MTFYFLHMPCIRTVEHYKSQKPPDDILFYGSKKEFTIFPLSQNYKPVTIEKYTQKSAIQKYEIDHGYKYPYIVVTSDSKRYSIYMCASVKTKRRTIIKYSFFTNFISTDTPQKTHEYLIEKFHGTQPVRLASSLTDPA